MYHMSNKLRFFNTYPHPCHAGQTLWMSPWNVETVEFYLPPLDLFKMSFFRLRVINAYACNNDIILGITHRQSVGRLNKTSVVLTAAVPLIPGALWPGEKAFNVKVYKYECSQPAPQHLMSKEHENILMGVIHYICNTLWSGLNTKGALPHIF